MAGVQFPKLAFRSISDDEEDGESTSTLDEESLEPSGPPELEEEMGGNQSGFEE